MIDENGWTPGQEKPMKRKARRQRHEDLKMEILTFNLGGLGLDRREEDGRSRAGKPKPAA